MKDKHRTKFVTKDIFKCSVIGAFTKLNPKYMMHNPVMFVVEIGFVIALLLSIFPELFGPTDGINNVRLYNIFVCVILFVTVLFANFAEAVAEGRGKAQAESLKKTQKDTKARLLKADGTETVVSSSELKKGDVVMVSAGEIIPNDGEVIEGTASVDESAITGESAPVLRESGGDFASVTGGTTVVSDWLKIRITSNPGESFLDKMIALVEGASRKKTPNEIALQILLVALTIIFMIVIVTLYPIGRYSGVTLPVSTLIALAVCLIPTTIGALLSAIGIAGMDRVTRFNVIAMSGKAVEACGDVDTMILDKTGTITYGNRMAADFIPVSGVSVEELTKYAALSSLSDATPEGKSVVALAKERGVVVDESSLKGAEFIEFTAKTRMSGVDLPDGISIRKGASDAIVEYVKGLGGAVPADLQGHTDQVSKQGGTPLTVCVGKRVLGVIYLKDIVKDGLVERFARLRAIGIKTIMCTGTITYGNRMAADFIPVSGVSVEELTKYAALSSLSDATPEGKSVVALAKERGVVVDESSLKGAEFIEFTAKTRMSGVDLPDGISIRKGASDAIVEYVKGLGGAVPADLQGHTDQVSKQGGTPLTVCVGKRVLGVIYLKDIVKDGLVERFARLRAIGIKTIMCTGDNPLTAATIAQEAGVDGFIAECRPEDKIKVIKEEQAQGKIVAMTGDGTNDAPALAQADVGLAMNSGTTAAKEAANMVDLDSDPTKILEVVEIGKQLLITRGSLTTFSIANDIAKYFAIIPAMFMMVIPQMQVLNIMKLASPTSAILSALIFNAIIIPCLIPLAMRGVKYKPMSASKMLTRNMLIYGLGGVIVPFIGIKVIDLIIAPLLTMLGLGMAM